MRESIYLEQCKIIFDLEQDGFPFLWWPVASVIAIIFGYVVFRIYRVVVPLRIQSWQLPGIGLFGFCIAVAVFTIYLPSRAFLEYRELISLIHQGATKTVKGIVTDFHPYGHGSKTERFAVCGITFASDPNAIEPGYRDIHAKGSPIEDGVRAEITYVDKTITHAAICNGATGTSDCK